MNAQEILAQTTWTTEEKLEAACQYIDNQQDNTGFRDFVQQVHEETKPPEAGLNAKLSRLLRPLYYV